MKDASQGAELTITTQKKTFVVLLRCPTCCDIKQIIGFGVCSQSVSSGLIYLEQVDDQGATITQVIHNLEVTDVMIH